ncbi:hypothetical protein [Streptomyces brasiliscabiei]|uniref:Uncharacterized protein n=1 Tax=Streptomyces brasiliscabiei TaxID=2736302 RepID=A0ABU8GU81_9ACTN
MKTPGDDDTPPVDDETRERSAEQRNVTAPTPRDVRAKGRAEATDEDRPEPSSGSGEGS